MKIILIIAILAAVGIGILQHSKLSDLNAETARLKRIQASTASKRSDRSRVAEAPQEATAAQIELVRDTIIKAMIAHQNRNSQPDPERWKQALLAGKSFSGTNIARLVELLESDSLFAGLKKDEIIAACSIILSETSPAAWREYLEANRDLPDWQNLFDSAIRRCLQADSKRAIEQFEEETTRGNRDFATSGIRTGVLLKLAAIDPDKMLTMAVSPEFSADPDALFEVGGFAASTIKNLPDHQRFLAALRRAQERNPSPVLAEIRKDYVNNMANKFYQWPAAEAISLIQSEFTADERFQAAEQSASRADLPEPESWMDWFLNIDPAEWSAWTSREKNRLRHPVVRQIESRAIADSQLAGTWLAKIPPGELRDEATLNYAWMIADREPDRAAGYLAELPESKGKQNLLKKISKAKR